MANIKISELPDVSTLTSSDTFPVVQGGVTKEASINKILDLTLAQTATTFGEGAHTPSVFTNNFAQDATTPLKIWLTGFESKHICWSGILDCSLVTFPSNTFVQMFRLPATYYRPTKILYFPVVGLYSAIGLCAVHPDGYVYVKNLTGDLLDSGLIDFSNVSYYVDPF